MYAITKYSTPYETKKKGTNNTRSYFKTLRKVIMKQAI